MLKKWVAEKGNTKTENTFKNEDHRNEHVQDMDKHKNNEIPAKRVSKENINTILKGSKLIGDINVTCDLELSGDVEGNIKAEQDANIIIKGTCKGNIETSGGNIDIRGELKSGNVTTGGNVSITGKFNGGGVKANGKIYVNCAFKGKLEGNEIDIGPNAQVNGELVYKEYISISRGAIVDVHLCRGQEGIKTANKSPEKKVIDMKSPVKELSEVK